MFLAITRESVVGFS